MDTPQRKHSGDGCEIFANQSLNNCLRPKWFLLTVKRALATRIEFNCDYTRLPSGSRYRRFLLARNRANSFRYRSKAMFKHYIASHLKDNNKSFYAYNRANAHNRRDSFLGRTDHCDLASSFLHSANVFVAYFVKRYRLVNHLPISRLPVPTSLKEQLHFTPTTVASILVRLDPHTSVGPEALDTSLIRLLSPIIAAPVTDLFNNSYDAGVIPGDWGKAKVTNIYKAYHQF